MNCVCLICWKPSREWFEFLSAFATYKVFVVVDDNAVDLKEYVRFTNVKIVRIPDEECGRAGFCNTCITLRKKITGWSKALYYFSSVETSFDRVWFFEDDVFFYDERTLLDLDQAHTAADLLSNAFFENADGLKNFWHWRKIQIAFLPPYYNTMICCVRASKQMLAKLKAYADEHKTLFFSEALFPTIGRKEKLLCEAPKEFKNVVYRKDFEDSEIDQNNLYHPMKKMEDHLRHRERLPRRPKVDVPVVIEPPATVVISPPKTVVRPPKKTLNFRKMNFTN
jgi:hypothetical protein